MRLEYIREFVTLCDTGKFQKTADTLFVAQSTLSKHMSALEDELGVTLLDRSGRTVTLSTQGKQFLPFARRMLSLQEEYTKALAGSEPDESPGGDAVMA